MLFDKTHLPLSRHLEIADKFYESKHLLAGDSGSLLPYISIRDRLYLHPQHYLVGCLALQVVVHLPPYCPLA